MSKQGTARRPSNWYSRQALAAHGDRNPRPLDRLDNGTPYFAPIGVLIYDPEAQLVQCHLCGHWYRSVGRHAWKWHGWKHSQYVEVFGLAQQRALCTPGMSQRQSQRLKEIYVESPVMRENLRRGQRMLFEPEVRNQWRQARDTAQRPERLRKLRLLMNALQKDQAERVRDRHQQRVRELGFERLEDYLTERYAIRQIPFHQICTELGAGYEFVSRAVDQLGLKQPGGVPGTRPEHVQARRWQRLRELGFDNFEVYLRNRYVEHGWTSHQIASELHVHYSFVTRSLREAGVPLRQGSEVSRLARMERRKRRDPSR